MGILKNKEIREYVFSFAVSMIVPGILAVLFPKYAFVWILAEGILFLVLFFIFMNQRYKDINRITEKIDQILHGKDELELGEFKEGDLEILKDEIYKMTIRLREQNEQMKKEKTRLADALADISHQIRTPLTSLNLMLERIKQSNMDEMQKRRNYREMEHMLQRMEWLITALLKMSKLEAGTVVLEKKKLNIRKFLSETIRPFEIAMELRNQKLIFEGEEDCCFFGDEAWTAEAIGNVIKNCMEHTPESGKIKIAWKKNPLYTEIRITDSGPGIPEKDLPHIFERFYRRNQSGNLNFGIGLALARSILVEEGGVIFAKNKKEGGAVFIIRFYEEKE